MARLEPLSSTKTNSVGSKWAWAWRQAARSASSRSAAVSFFFVRPTQGAARPVQGGHAQGLPGPLLPALAMVNQAAVGIGLQLGAQGPQGFRRAKGRPRARAVAVGRQALARPPLGEPTFQSG